MDTFTKIAADMFRTVQTLDPGGQTEAGRLVRGWHERIVALINRPPPVEPCRLCGSEPQIVNRVVYCANCNIETEGDNALIVWNAVMRPVTKDK